VSAMRAVCAVLLLAVAALLPAGCSSGPGRAGSSQSPSAPASSSPGAAVGASSAICQAVTAVRASLAELSHITPGANALGKLKTDLGNVKTSLVTLKTTAGTQWQSRIGALTSALSKMQKTLTSLGSQPSATAAAQAVSTDLAAVTSAGSDLLRTASVRCPKATSSPSA
jgi:hypothetical protein